MYARGISVREVRGHLEEIYGIEVSPDLVSAITDAVLDEVSEWQNRPLDLMFPSKMHRLVCRLTSHHLLPLASDQKMASSSSE